MNPHAPVSSDATRCARGYRSKYPSHSTPATRTPTNALSLNQNDLALFYCCWTSTSQPVAAGGPSEVECRGTLAGSRAHSEGASDGRDHREGDARQVSWDLTINRAFANPLSTEFTDQSSVRVAPDHKRAALKRAGSTAQPRPPR